MAFSRYTRDALGFGGRGLTIAQATTTLRQVLRSGLIIPSRTLTVTQADRLDTIAGEIYGDAKYWWILAAASDIGWGMQVPPGTVLFVLDLDTVERLVG
jgi:hypothetical protein